LDGKQQIGVLGAAVAPIPNASWGVDPIGDFAFSSTEFEQVVGTAVHTRGIRHIRGAGVIVVVDRVISDRPRTVTALWHGHPNCSLTVLPTGSSPTSLTVAGMTASLTVQAAGRGVAWERAEVLHGVGDTSTGAGLQGWYSERYDTAVAAPVALFHADVAGNATFAWVIATANTAGGAPIVQATIVGGLPVAGTVQVRVRVAGKDFGVVDIPLTTSS
jgi:hypothetical protein